MVDENNYLVGTFTMIDRPFNWAQEYHVLFVDQPMGVGYSYIKDDRVIFKFKI